MNEVLSFFSVQAALIAIVLVLHTYMGLHVIRRTLVFSDLVLDQLAALGAMTAVAVGIKHGTPFSYVFAIFAVLIGAFLLAMFNPRNKLIPREAVIGILYALALAISLLHADWMSGGSTHIEKALSGSMLWVSWPLVGVTACVYSLLVMLHWILRKHFIALTENPSKVLRPKQWDFIFFSTQGIITVLIIPVAGVLLAYAFLMIPAAIALLFTKNWTKALVIGWSVGFVFCMLGLFLSYTYSWPYSPTLVLSLGLSFICAIVIRIIKNCSEGEVMS